MTLALTLTAVALLIKQRAAWQMAAAHLPLRGATLSFTRWISGALCITGAVGLCATARTLASAGPGEESDRRATILVVDTSTSMHARDVSPSRLGAAQAILLRALDTAGGRFAVIAFAGDAAVRCPLTTDRDAVRSAIALLDSESTLRPGTSIGTAITAAIGALGDGTTTAAILLVSDGENMEGSIDEAVAKARGARVPIHVLGAGTPEGAPVPRYSAPVTSIEQDRELDVPVTRLDEALLRRLAGDTGGLYVAARSEEPIGQTAHALDPLGEAAAGGLERSPRWDIARTQVLVALVLLALATWLVPIRL